ncbi:MAG: hypothetical protein ACI9R3_006232, partial [Verrucomicrobiales bacterium]
MPSTIAKSKVSVTAEADPGSKPGRNDTATRTSDTPDAKIPEGPIQDKWSKHKMDSKLINPNNKRKYNVIV